MSAFLVSQKHIATMVANIRNHVGEDNFARLARYRLGIMGTGDELLVHVANALWKENNRSVNYRYSERNKAPQIKAFPWEEVAILDVAGLNDLIRCWDYQTCEPKNWMGTKAFRFISEVRERLLNEMISRHYPTELRESMWSI